MKKFQFPLDTVLGYKQQVLENLQNEHSVLVRRVREQESLIAGLEANYAALNREFRQAEREGMTIARARAYELGLRAQERTIQTEYKRLAQLQAEAERKRLELAVEQARENAGQRSAEAQALEAEASAQEQAAQQAAARREALAGEAEQLTGELARLTQGGDDFAAQQSRLSGALAQKQLDQLARQKDAELCRSRVADWEQRLAEAGARKETLEENIRVLEAQDQEMVRAIQQVKDEAEQGRRTIQEKEAAIRKAADARMEQQAAETKAQAAARAAAEEREEAGREMARLSERKSAAEGEYDQLAAKLWDEYQLAPTDAAKYCVEYTSMVALRAQVAEVRGKIRALGSVNVGAVEEYQEVRTRYDTLKTQVEDVEESRSRLIRMIGELNGQMRDLFSRNFAAINQNFGRVFAELFGGGEASLSLENPEDILGSGIDIQVSPPGKVIRNLEALSGGERALVAISIYFAILAVNPSPFCILDEIEAALDDANVVRFAQYLRRIGEKTQFIVITHRRGTMEAADVLYGVTMQEDGVSKLLRLDLEHVSADLIS